MTAEALPAPMRREPGRLRTFLTTIRAVLTRELRWRMRGRRAFVIATVFVLLLGLLVFLIYQLLYDNAANQSRFLFDDGFSGDLPLPGADVGISGAAAVRIGQAIFAGVLGVLTALVLLIAPALTSGVVSSEREKQTLEMLVTTPVSSLGLLLGKLIGSLAYVFLLILASVPLVSIAFAFGGIGPEDVLRAYAVVLALAFGTGCIGLFLSALIGRTQVATVVSYLIVFGLIVGTGALWLWMYSNSVQDDFRQNAVQERRHAPEALLWLNPLMTDIDVMCAVMPGEGGFCGATSEVMGLPQGGMEQPRDAFWPRSVLAFVVLGGVLVVISTQLISPSRGIRSRRRSPAVPRAPDRASDPTP